MIANASGTDSVIMMKNDGTAEMVLANQSGWFEAVQLSLDGKKGVGTAEDLTGYYQVFYVDLSAGNLSNLNPVQLTTDPEDHWYPQIAPDGSKVIFVKDTESGPQAFTVSVSGGTETMIPVAPGIEVNFPAYTPNGKKIVFEEEWADTINIMNSDGSGVVTLTNQDGTYEDEMPSVSADGKTITFARHDQTGINIYAVNVDGTNLRQLTTEGASMDPLFVNDKIVFVSYRDGIGGRMYAMLPDGSTQTNLTPHDATDDYFLLE